jgi:hypothetical protein
LPCTPLAGLNRFHVSLSQHHPKPHRKPRPNIHQNFQTPAAHLALHPCPVAGLYRTQDLPHATEPKPAANLYKTPHNNLKQTRDPKPQLLTLPCTPVLWLVFMAPSTSLATLLFLGCCQAHSNCRACTCARAARTHNTHTRMENGNTARRSTARHSMRFV